MAAAKAQARTEKIVEDDKARLEKHRRWQENKELNQAHREYQVMRCDKLLKKIERLRKLCRGEAQD